MCRKSCKKAIIIFLLFILTAVSCSCKTTEKTSVSPQSSTSEGTASGVFTAPEINLSKLSYEQAEKIDLGVIDLSSLQKGYVALSVNDTKRLKFQVIVNDETYTYDLPNDGTETAYPLNMGSGTYKFRIMENIDGNKYAENFGDSVSVTLDSEFEPFIRPNQICNYTEDSACTALAKSLSQNCKDDLSVVSSVYDYLVKNISYDYEKAKTVQSGYIPDPDSTLSSKTGICYDYAALAAAMLRSLSIPTQVVTGYVAPDNVYHAWNRIYIKGQGWIAVEIKSPGDAWNRVDITFAASGVDTSKLIDNTLYTTRYTY